MTNDPVIRFVREGDLQDLIVLCQRHAEFEKSDYDPVSKNEMLGQFLFAHNPALFCLVVELGSKLIGYATYMRQFSTWDSAFYIYMDCLFMTEEARGQGLGEKLVDRIKLESQKLECTQIQWQTPDFNKRAMKFYDRIGAKSKSKERYFLEINS